MAESYGIWKIFIPITSLFCISVFGMNCQDGFFQIASDTSRKVPLHNERLTISLRQWSQWNEQQYLERSLRNGQDFEILIRAHFSKFRNTFGDDAIDLEENIDDIQLKIRMEYIPLEDQQDVRNYVAAFQTKPGVTPNGIDATRAMQAMVPVRDFRRSSRDLAQRVAQVLLYYGYENPENHRFDNWGNRKFPIQPKTVSISPLGKSKSLAAPKERVKQFRRLFQFGSVDKNGSADMSIAETWELPENGYGEPKLVRIEYLEKMNGDDGDPFLRVFAMVLNEKGEWETPPKNTTCLACHVITGVGRSMLRDPKMQTEIVPFGHEFMSRLYGGK